MSICQYLATRHVNMSTCQYVNMSICGTKTSKYLDFFAREAIRSVTLASPELQGTPKIDHFRIRIPKWPDVTITHYLLYFSHVLEVPRPPKNRYFDTLNRLQSTPDVNMLLCGSKTCQVKLAFGCCSVNLSTCQYVNMSICGTKTST